MNRIAKYSACGVALAAALLALSLALCAVLPGQAHASRAYGALCSKYESGNNPACIDSGIAYGAYQMGYETARKFGTWLTQKSTSHYAEWGKKLNAAKSTSAFNKAWKSIASQYSSAFFTAQYQYCKDVYYHPAVAYWKKIAPKLKMSNFSTALSAVVFSTSLQHGPYGSAYKIFQPALKSLGGWKSSLTEKQLINAIYYERARVTSKAPGSPAYKIASTEASRSYGIAGKYLAHFFSCSSAIQIGVYNRLHNVERKDALALMQKSQSTTSTTTSPTKLTITYNLKGGVQASGQKKSFTPSTATFSLKAPTRTGYTFKGWYTSLSYKTKITKVKTGTSKNLTLYAKWEVMDTPLRIMITQNAGVTIYDTFASGIREKVGTIKKGKVVEVTKIYKTWGKLSSGKGWIFLKYQSVA